MARPKSAKIYIRRGENLYSFMWANVGPDGSVMLGFSFHGKEEVELVLDKELGELRPPAVVTKETIGRPKMSFHSSGHYKLTAEMGKNLDAVDRATIEGPRLTDIIDPRRMVELLLPKMLPEATENPTELDIVLDATSSPDMPLRCTISCMSKGRLASIVEKNEKFVDTSVWEFVHALENDTHEWVWTLRGSRNDEVYFDRFGIFLLGDVKWGQPVQ